MGPVTRIFITLNGHYASVRLSNTWCLDEAAELLRVLGRGYLEIAIWSCMDISGRLESFTWMFQRRKGGAS